MYQVTSKNRCTIQWADSYLCRLFVHTRLRQFLVLSVLILAPFLVLAHLLSLSLAGVHQSCLGFVSTVSVCSRQRSSLRRPKHHWLIGFWRDKQKMRHWIEIWFHSEGEQGNIRMELKRLVPRDNAHHMFWNLAFIGFFVTWWDDWVRKFMVNRDTNRHKHRMQMTFTKNRTSLIISP